LQWLVSTNFDFRRKAVLDGSLEIARVPKTQPPNEADAGRVNSIQEDWNEITIEVTANRESLLVLNDTWYPGWKATINGVSQPIQRANAFFRGVIVDAGTHRVSFVYQPWRFRASLWVTFATVLFTSAGLAFHSRYQKVRLGAPSPV
jgi:uncharacterized membrane protein YfhO